MKLNIGITINNNGDLYAREFFDIFVDLLYLLSHSMLLNQIQYLAVMNDEWRWLEDGQMHGS